MAHWVKCTSSSTRLGCRHNTCHFYRGTGLGSGQSVDGRPQAGFPPSTGQAHDRG